MASCPRVSRRAAELWSQHGPASFRKNNMKIIRSVSLCLITLTLAGFAQASPPPTSVYFVYFFTYTGFRHQTSGALVGKSKSKGIYVARFHPATGELGELQLAAAITNPS